jgi:hypothetical protein
MTHEGPKLTDEAIERALARRAPHGPAGDLLPSIVAQAAGVSQARRAPFVTGRGLVAGRQLAWLAVALATIAALVGIMIAGAGSKRDQLSLVPSGDPRASVAANGDPSPGTSPSAAASSTDCTTDHVVVAQGADMPPALVAPNHLTRLAQVEIAYLTGSDVQWTVGNVTIDGGRYDLWMSGPAGAATTTRAAVIGGPGVDWVFTADLRSGGSLALVVVGKVSPSGANPECTDVYAIPAVGSGSRRLTHSTRGQLVLGASISPDGRLVAYLRSTMLAGPRSVSSIGIVDPTTGALERTIELPCTDSSDGGYREPVRWSPAGDRIAVRCGSGNVVVDPSGRAPVQELTSPWADLGSGWTGPDRLTALWAGSNGPNLQSVDVATGARSPVIAIPGGRIDWVSGTARLSPDGRWVYLEGYPASDDLGYLIPAAGGDPRQVLSANQTSDGVAWDPAGRLVYVDRSDPATWSLVALDPTSGERTELMVGPSGLGGPPTLASVTAQTPSPTP